ncbi:MAG: SLBB domain-containing protein [bacterium]
MNKIIDNYMNKWFIVAILIAFGINLFAQSQSDLLNMAKAAGYSDAQIQALISQQQNKSVSTQGRVLDVPIDGERLDTFLYVQPDIAKVNLDTVVFGREIFNNKNLTFAPSLNIATPKDYVLSAGDEVRIDIWGSSTYELQQKISAEGRILVENLGPIQIGGLTVDKAEKRVKSAMAKIYSGLNGGSSFLSLTLSQIRTIKVNVVGEAYMPGTYVLPSFSTLFNALYSAGGVNDIGSLRSIKVYRNNKLEAELDAYDYLLNGKSETNIILQDEDIIMVEPYDALVKVTGEVKRKRIYEMKEGETLADLMRISGGFKGGAYKESVQLQRISGASYSIKTIKNDKFASVEMLDGDTVNVRPIAERYENRIAVKGAVWYPGNYELNDEVNSVKSLVEFASGLKGDEFLGRAHITRINPDFTSSVIAVDISGIMNGTAEDVMLQKDDILHIPSIFDLREKYTFKVSGAVNIPDSTFDYISNMTVEDAIIMAGGLLESAASVNIDIARRLKDPKSSDSSTRLAEVFTVELVDGLAIAQDGTPIILEPFDEVYVRFSPGYSAQKVVTIGGEVVFRGDYVLRNANTRVSDILKDAGGVTDAAYLKGASLKRKMSEDEAKRIEALSVVDGVKVLQKQTYSVGIDLYKAVNNPGSEDDVVLMDGDEIYIPQMQSTVKVSGAVLQPNSLTYVNKVSAREYVNMAGGYGDSARKRPFVVYMNGKISKTKKYLFFKSYPKIEPGCEVVVPTKDSSNKMSTAETVAISTSVTSMAATISTIVYTIVNTVN